MATRASEKPLAWDSFLEEDSPARVHVESFREIEWPNILRQARNDYGQDLRDGEEPHWVSSGKAVYWQRQLILEREELEDGSGRRIVERDHGWLPTGPLPANNAGQITHYLQKGFRLRPPSEGVDVEVLEIATPTEDSGASQAKETYVCTRHEGRKRAFATWKGYARHCDTLREPMQERPPDAVLAKMRDFQDMWYCLAHAQGFSVKRTATRHVNSYIRRPAPVPHSTVKQMEVSLSDNGKPGVARLSNEE